MIKSMKPKIALLAALCAPLSMGYAQPVFKAAEQETLKHLDFNKAHVDDEFIYIPHKEKNKTGSVWFTQYHASFGDVFPYMGRKQLTVQQEVDFSALESYDFYAASTGLKQQGEYIRRARPILPSNAHLCELTKEAKAIFRPNSGNVVGGKHYPTHVALCGYTLTFWPQFEDEIKRLIEDEAFFETYYSIDSTPFTQAQPVSEDLNVLPMDRIIKRLVNKNLLKKQSYQGQEGYIGNSLDLFYDTTLLSAAELGFSRAERQSKNFRNLRKERWKLLMKKFEFVSDQSLEPNMSVFEALKNTQLFLSVDPSANRSVPEENRKQLVIQVDTRY